MSVSCEKPSSVPPEVVVIGQLGAVHGIRGELRLFPLSDIPGRFTNLKKVWWLGPQGKAQLLQVSTIRPGRGYYLICFSGYEDRTAAGALSRGHLGVEGALRAQAPAGTFFQDDILGMEVFDENGQRLGQVTQIYQTGANDVFEIQGGRKEWLLPALKSIVVKVDVAARRMQVRVPDEW